jgi:hypothetical protein
MKRRFKLNHYCHLQAKNGGTFGDIAQGADLIG